MWRLSAASAALLVITATACAGSAKTSSSTTSSTSTKPSVTVASSTTTTTVAPPRPCVVGSTTEQKTPVSAGIVQLVGVNVGSAAPCGDIVTFVFPSGAASQVPGYDVGYKNAPFYDAGSGKLHQVGGNAFLVVRMEKAAIIDLSRPGAPPTYTGPLSIHPPGLAHVKDLEVIDAFEGVLTWVIGLDSRQKFHVATGASIPSIVVTIG